ncbi:phasin family protein [Pontibacter sp. JAM-7]|uniref:phasin family protein n=1 Tax=Pontibacter sp. JAM-7 TaxID=3366581 RepID=UPI003AF60A5B
MYDMNKFADMFKAEIPKEFADFFKPVEGLVEVNKKTAEVLTALSKDSFETLSSASVEQFKALCECKDPKAAMDLQVKFYKLVETKLTETTEKSLATLTEAKDAYMSSFEESTKKVTEMAEEVAKKVPTLQAA